MACYKLSEQLQNHYCFLPIMQKNIQKVLGVPFSYAFNSQFMSILKKVKSQSSGPSNKF